MCRTKDAFIIDQPLEPRQEQEVNMFDCPEYAKWDAEVEKQLQKEFGDQQPTEPPF